MPVMTLGLLQWTFSVLMILIIFQSVCLIFNTTNSQDSRDEVTDTLHQFHCAKLRAKFSVIRPAKSININKFTQEVSDLMNCPYTPNIIERELNRVNLKFCCNATENLFLTKHNTAVNQEIQYENNIKRIHKMDAKLHRMLPEGIPWISGGLGRCAVVGSGGILQNSSCGQKIDSADFVIRFNLATLNVSDVGVKTNLVTINPSQIEKNYRNLEKNASSLVERVRVYGNAHLIIPAFAKVSNTKWSLQTLRALRPFRPQQPVVFFSPSYLRTLDRFWKERGLKEIRLSTGFMMINVALELCQDVDVYGFWPFDTDFQLRPLPYHYYDEIRPSRHMHAMPEEFMRLLQMHSQGALTLHLQQCS
ncbi:alpha-2,8-sialyltransferase 8F-like [Paramisgurnus dabryanus]|uniref:alpha-2,8-sialyltransferase 8F-like n=1 Tax=Paramisgurnus dabryanus TaxID=90735 RepID=UPI0031F36C33